MIKQSKSGHTLTILLCGVYFSIVCRDFAVLEDHCLAHNLQEQESEYAGISQEILLKHVLEKIKKNEWQLWYTHVTEESEDSVGLNVAKPVQQDSFYFFY